MMKFLFFCLLMPLSACTNFSTLKTNSPEEIIAKPFNLETLYQEGSLDSHQTDQKTLVAVFPKNIYGNETSGFSFGSRLEPGLSKTISYEVMFPHNFDFVKGGKLPGLCGGRNASGGNRASGTNGFSARLMWRKGGRLVSYVYHMGQADNYGDDFQWSYKNGTSISIERGVWHQIKMTVKVNELGKTNGRIEGHFDGVIAFNGENFAFRTAPQIQVDRLCFNTFFGGDDASWAPSKDERLYIRNLVVEAP